VVERGTARSLRQLGVGAPVAGKTGTSDGARDAWFVGFTPELLAVVWVGYDDNRPLSLSGSQAALPIWTEFMKSALAGRPGVSFEEPDGVTFAQIDRETGKLASPGCPRTRTEVFLDGTAPTEFCELHR
jgi:penicillin-binding protein 1B